MVSVDLVLDSANDTQAAMFIDADTRNHLAFIELDNYNKTKQFLYLHPLLKEYKLENDLNQLRISDPEKFMNDLINASKNITRYRSLISNNKYKNEDEKADWLNIIEEYNNKLLLMKRLISKN